MAVFNELNSKRIEVINYPLIYFLIKDDEVVYVGQTKYGLSRPFSHRDKEFNQIEIIKCAEANLDILEDKYIIKYQPKYNTKINNGYALMTARNKLRKMLNNQITIRDIKKTMKFLNLSQIKVGNNQYILNDSIIKIYEYLEGNDYARN